MINLIFDVDDTLYDQITPFWNACTETFDSLPGISKEALYCASRKYSDEAFPASVSGEMSMDDMYVYRIQKALLEFGVTKNRETCLAFQHRYAYHQSHLTMSATMQALVGYAKEKQYLLGIITNGPSAHQWKKVHTLGVEAWIPTENILVSGDLDVTKPSAEIFKIAEARMGILPEETWYIGDSYENDVVGAKNAGWHVLWLNKRRNPLPPDGRKPDIEVHTEEELLEAVQALQPEME